MTAEEAAMIMMSGGSANIQSLTVTQNGRYDAPAGVDGFNPVDVKVPDRYDEGYKDGYDEGYADGEAAVKAKIQSKTITKNGTYYAADDGLDGFDPVIVNIPAPETGYTLPPTISADEFLQFVGGNANVSDETTGFKLVWRYNGNGSKTLCVTNGIAYIGLATMPISDYLTVFTIDRSTGKFYAKSNTGDGWSSTVYQLIGFGDPSHTNVAENVK
ncbi:MAG: hypothetical protein PUH30_06990 [Oscillospiraceae bacterium]|nr:hypothetical protein [Oscillospiraceae bacterium]